MHNRSAPADAIRVGRGTRTGAAHARRAATNSGSASFARTFDPIGCPPVRSGCGCCASPVDDDGEKYCGAFGAGTKGDEWSSFDTNGITCA